MSPRRKGGRTNTNALEHDSSGVGFKEGRPSLHDRTGDAWDSRICKAARPHESAHRKHREETGDGLTHDPKRVVEAMRDHLARHDKPIAFLFGAGTSADPQGAVSGTSLIPAVGTLTELCEAAVKALGPAFVGAWDSVVLECDANDGNHYIEAMLTRFRLKVDAVGTGETLAGLDRADLELARDTIQTTIASAVQPPENEIPDVLPHHHLARWLSLASRQRPVEIFTTNYDLLFERALEDLQVPTFDGFAGSFRPFFLAESLTRADSGPASSWTRLWKVHGSVNWRWTDIGGARRIVRTQPTGSGELILPSYRKYDESRKQPYIAILDRLGRFLAQDDALLVTSGYSFGDEHINDVLFAALGRPSRTHIVALFRSDPANLSSAVTAAMQRPNIEVLARNRAWIGGQEGEWRLHEPVTTATARFMDIAFDSDAVPDPNTPALTGAFRLGEFSRLCRFLGTMTDSAS